MDLLQQVLDALGLGGPGQHQRLIRLHTPLGSNVLMAERAQVEEAIAPDAGSGHAGFRVKLTALSTRCDLALPALLGQPVLLELLTAASRTELRPWHGHVTRFESLGSDGGLARYELVIEPWLAFLRWRRDSFVYLDMTLPEIVEAVFSRYAGQGRLAPAWRWALADGAFYPRRSQTIQHDESDLHFVSRLLAADGLFCWFEHAGDTHADALGTHTLVIADHNGAFTPEPMRLPFTQSGSAAFSEDGLQRWAQQHELRTHSVELASFDYRSLGTRAVSASAVAHSNVAHCDVALSAVDVPGQYAYEDSTQGERLASRWLDALQAPAERWQGRGSVRSVGPGTRFQVLDSPAGDRGPFVALQLIHRARSNLSAATEAGLQQRLGALPGWAGEARGANSSDEPLYQLNLVAQRSTRPVRAPDTARGLAPQHTVHGTQTALVVGLDAPVHTDRDHRVKVQFHWQRGSSSSHGLAGVEDNAPASDASGTWVRVSEAWAGDNWGSNFTPRLGQEVVVAFAHGEVNRGVVVSAVYNGVGQRDAQGNGVAGGAAGATGNAPAWFPGQQAQGGLQGHNHPAVLSGHKSQELSASASGFGGSNQWVLDDTPGANRIELSSSTAQTRLQLGHLLNQRDNLRLQPRGHGFDLATQAFGALRAGSGLLLSAHGRPDSTAGGQQMDSREPQAVLQSAQELTRTLAESAQGHEAKTAPEPAADALPVAKTYAALLDSLQASDGGGEPTGGQGVTAAFGRPELLLAAPAGIGAFTPASLVASAGRTASVSAAQDISVATQRHHAVSVREGMVWFTYGMAQNPDKPNTETGIRLHAASGSVRVQASTGQAQLTASRKVEVASTDDAVKLESPSQTLLSAAGSAIRIGSDGITLSTGGPAVFRGAVKSLEGAAKHQVQALMLPKPSRVVGCAQTLADACGSGDVLLPA